MRVVPDEEAPEALIGEKGVGRAYVTASEFAKPWPNPKTLIFKLIGCIDYSFSSNGRHGQTGFAFIISRKVPNELGHETGFIPGRRQFRQNKLFSGQTRSVADTLNEPTR